MTMFVFTIFLTLLATCYCKVEIKDRAGNFSAELLYFTAVEMEWHTVISPLGVWDLLSAVSMGASGLARRQLRRGLFLPTTKNTFLGDYKTFMDDVIRPANVDVVLKIKNYIFVDKSVGLKTEIEQVLKNDFKVSIGKLPFNTPAIAAERANKVISASRVVEFDVFGPDDFDNAKMILTNLISFTGLWQSPFNASETHVESFHDEEGNVVGQVNMMEQEAEFKSANLAQINATVLKLPYGDDEIYSFLIVLPFSGIKVSSVYSALATFGLKAVLRKLDRIYKKSGAVSVNVKLPRFKISTNVILNKPLQNMGIVSIFSPESRSFSAISDSNDLYVSAIVHKAEIRVTEVGTTASASSSAYFIDRASPSKFSANRPFLYFIMKDSTATSIFSGVYRKPNLF